MKTKIIFGIVIVVGSALLVKLNKKAKPLPATYGDVLEVVRKEALKKD